MTLEFHLELYRDEKGKQFILGVAEEYITSKMGWGGKASYF